MPSVNKRIHTQWLEMLFGSLVLSVNVHILCRAPQPRNNLLPRRRKRRRSFACHPSPRRRTRRARKVQSERSPINDVIGSKLFSLATRLTPSSPFRGALSSPSATWTFALLGTCCSVDRRRRRRRNFVSFSFYTRKREGREATLGLLLVTVVVTVYAFSRHSFHPCTNERRLQDQCCHLWHLRPCVQLTMYPARLVNEEEEELGHLAGFITVIFTTILSRRLHYR